MNAMSLPRKKRPLAGVCPRDSPANEKLWPRTNPKWDFVSKKSSASSLEMGYGRWGAWSQSLPGSPFSHVLPWV